MKRKVAKTIATIRPAGKAKFGRKWPIKYFFKKPPISYSIHFSFVPNSGVQIFVEHWGDNLQFYPNFALFSTLGRMNLDHNFFQVSKLSEEQKKRSSPTMQRFFPRIQVKTKKKVFTKNGTRRVARNSQWRGG